MSYFEDFIADGLCCESCGAMIDETEPGFVRQCASCAPKAAPAKRRKPKKRKPS